MGGDLRFDKAIEKFAAMRETVQEHAYWTPRLVRTALIWVVGVPLAVMWAAHRYDNLFDATGKERGMALYRYPRLVYKDEIDADKAAASESKPADEE